MKSLKLRKVGNSSGVCLPKELLARHHLNVDDELCIIETTDGFFLTPYNTALNEQIELSKTTLKKNRTILKALLQ